jgi:hypothetical protein
LIDEAQVEICLDFFFSLSLSLLFRNLAPMRGIDLGEKGEKVHGLDAKRGRSVSPMGREQGREDRD